MWHGIYGHDELVEGFRRRLAERRLASTYLFVGPDGVGKRTFALQLARVLLCRENDPAQMEPCGRCDSCRLAAAGNHPDLDVVVPPPGKRHLLIKQFIGQDEKRNQEGLCHNIALRPMLGPRRVAIIDEADWLTVESANCLLKTLEEPPRGAVIILVATSRLRLLPTILSRSQVINFRPLAVEVVRELVVAEGLATDAAAAQQIAESSGGTLAGARQFADDELRVMQTRFAAQWNSGELDAPRLVRDAEEFINAAGKEAEARRLRLRQLVAGAADTLVDSLRRMQHNVGVETTLAGIDRCIEAEEQLDRNANQQTLLESWVDDLALAHSAKSS